MGYSLKRQNRALQLLTLSKSFKWVSTRTKQNVVEKKFVNFTINPWNHGYKTII